MVAPTAAETEHLCNALEGTTKALEVVLREEEMTHLSVAAVLDALITPPYNVERCAACGIWEMQCTPIETASSAANVTLFERRS